MIFTFAVVVLLMLNCIVLAVASFVIAKKEKLPQAVDKKVTSFFTNFPKSKAKLKPVVNTDEDLWYREKEDGGG